MKTLHLILAVALWAAMTVWLAVTTCAKALIRLPLVRPFFRWLRRSVPALKLYTRTSALALLGSCLAIAPPFALLTGCTQSQVDGALQKIQANIPVAEGLANAVAPIVETIDPASALVLKPFLAAVNAGLPELDTLIGQYESNPDASVLQKIQTLVNDIVSSGSQALLAAAHIESAASQQKATAALSALQGSLVILDGLIQNIETPAVVKANAATRKVKLAMLDPYLDHQQLDRFARANGTSYAEFLRAETLAGY